MKDKENESERETFADRWITEAEETIAAEKAEIVALAGKFFVQVPTDSIDANDPLRPPIPASVVKPKRKRFKNPELDALAHLAHVLEDAPQNVRRASIGWLADKYLGIRFL